MSGSGLELPTRSEADARKEAASTKLFIQMVASLKTHGELLPDGNRYDLTGEEAFDQLQRLIYQARSILGVKE